MAFVTRPDFAPFIKDARLSQMLDDEPQALDEAVLIAESTVRDALYSRYDVATIFAATDPNRHMSVVRWVISLALYYMYERLPDKLVPQRVVKNYDDCIALLTDIEDAKKSVNLPLIVLDAADPSTVATKFRWGSNPTRTH